MIAMLHGRLGHTQDVVQGLPILKDVSNAKQRGKLGTWDVRAHRALVPAPGVAHGNQRSWPLTGRAKQASYPTRVLPGS